MDPGFLVDGILRSMMGGRRKRSRRALKYLTRGGGGLARTAMAHPTALLTAAGVAWGIFETLQNSGQTQAGTAGAGMSPVVPPPGTGGVTPAVPLPPLPPLPGGARAPVPAAADDALVMVRLAVSAAHADGAVNDEERTAILQHAREAGVLELMERELSQPRPLREIVHGVTDPAHRATLYVLAFTILRADEQLTGAERIYLAQLANLLGLDRDTAARLEQDAGQRIDGDAAGT